MGNQSEKKNKQHRDKVIGFYFYPTVILGIAFLIQNYLSEYLFSFTGFIFVLLISLVQYYCYTTISKSLDLGLSYESYSIQLDILGLNGIVQIGTWISDLFWNVYWILPLILIYKFGGVVWGWLQKPQYAEETETGKKKKEKKEKVKYIK